MPRPAKEETARHEPIWERTATLPAFRPLGEDLAVDVCVVGAGIAGLTTAYLLAQEGRSVAVLNDGPLGGGMTGVTTAHLSNAIDARYYEIERLHGAEGARLTAESHTAAIARIEAIVEREGVDCDFERLNGTLILHPGGRDEDLDRELEAAHRAGLTGVVKVARSPLESPYAGPRLVFPNQGQFHPLKYLAGLARAIERDGGRIFTQSRADAIEGGATARIQVANRTVTAQEVVVATNSPVNDLVVLHTKQVPYTSYVLGARVPRGSVAKGLYWDTEDPYHYVRLHRLAGDEKTEILIVGGEDQKSGHADDASERYARLESWARKRFPSIERVEYTWAGQVMETIDGLAFLGRNPLDEGNVYVATGDCGMGMTHGTIAGILLTDLIQGRENPWAQLYDPARITLRAAGTYLRDGLDVALQYADWLRPGDVGSADEIEPGCGAILRRGLSKIAVYRDESGELHERSAACPHLGCIVQWNSNDKTWDCPCHGSRFDKLGKVVNGPANRDLAALDE